MNSISLRWYQSQAVQATWDYIRDKPGNPCIELPTGAGKSVVIAQLMADTVAWGGRVVLLAHRKELLAQTADKITSVAPDIDVGVYSAGLKRRDTEHDCLVAGIQSVHKRADELGVRDVIIVDEAHLIPAAGDGMFRRFLSDAKMVAPHCRLVGLTATPYRLDSGEVCGPDNILNDICYRVGVRELIVEGFLCPLRSKSTEAKMDTSGVSIKGGEFVASELQDAVGGEELVAATVEEIVGRTANRHSVLVFTTGREHGRLVADRLSACLAGPVEYLDGETPSEERAGILDAFKAGDVKFLVNVDVLTTGFDAPNVDCVALLRPTMSPGLYYQMVGRGFRIHSSKSDCLVLDFGGNVERHGPVDAIQVGQRRSSGGTGEPVTKVCPDCQEIVAAAARICSTCQHEFPPPELKHSATASDAPILSSERQLSQMKESETFNVTRVAYFVHKKRGTTDADAPKTMRVDYWIGWNRYASEWVCVEHTGFAREKAEKWWRERTTLPFPKSAAQAVELCEAGYVKKPTAITITSKPGSRYDEITDHELQESPDVEPGDDAGVLDPWAQQAVEMFDGEVLSIKRPQTIGDFDNADDCPF